MLFELILSLRDLSPVYEANKGLSLRLFFQSFSKYSTNNLFSSVFIGTSISFSTSLITILLFCVSTVAQDIKINRGIIFI